MLAVKEENMNQLFLRAEHKAAIKHFLRIFTYSTWPDRLLIFAASLASICAGTTMPLMNVVFGKVFASFTGYYKPGNEQGTHMSFMDGIVECVLYLIYLFAARLFLDYISYLGFRTSSLRISAAMRLEYMRTLFKQPVSTLDAMPPGQTAAIITITANVLQSGISEKLGSLLQSISLVVSALVIAFSYSWSLTLVTSSGMVLIVAVYGVTTPFIMKIMNDVQHADIKAATIANEVFRSVRMVAAYGAEAKMAERYARWAGESRRRGLRMSPLVATQQASVFFAVYATFALAFWYSLKMFMESRINSPETLMVVLLSVMSMTTAIGGITGPLSGASRAAGAATVFYSIIDAQKSDAGGAKAPDVSVSGDITLKHVNFAYPNRPNLRILDDLNVTFPAGKLTAIVGSSGSGKSTIVGLLERWYELDGNETDRLPAFCLRNGIITIGGRPLKDLDVKWWRSQIGLVQQEPFLFNESVYRNVEHGLVGTCWENESPEIKSELVREACKEAYADEFIRRLPDGYDTRVGDAGIMLSGGQRQRLAIARSIVKQPRILIFDEATSAIDVRAERQVQMALDRASKNRTTITIAHRLSTVRKAHQIVVLRGGRVVQQGTHESLMAEEDGAYWSLATAQKLSFVANETSSDSSAASCLSEEKDMDTIMSEQAVPEDSTASVSNESIKRPKGRGTLNAFGLLIKEQMRFWPWYLVLLFGALIGGASAPVQAYLFAQLISLFQLIGNFWWLRVLANFWCFVFTMLAVAVGISYFALGWSATSLAFNITHAYRKECFANIVSKSMAFFDHDDHSAGALTARLATDPTQLQQLLGTNMVFVIISVLNVVGCLVISFYFGWKLTLVTVASAMPIIFAAAFFRVRYEKRFEGENNQVFAVSAKFASEAITAFRTVSALTLEDTICRRYEQLLHSHIKGAFKESALSTLIFSLSDSISLLCMAFVLWYGGTLMADREYYPFQYVIVYIAVMQGSTGAGQWMSYAPNIAQASVAAHRIIDMRQHDQVDGRLISLDFGNLGEDDKGVRIEFSNVWFRYPTRDIPVLTGLDLTIEKGQFAAIVGPSGSGKTTVISLLERFYSVEAGTISYNGSDIYDLCLSVYRRDISLVAQESSLFHGTLRENILMGADGSSVSDGEMHQACRDAEIHDFIVSLPEGYDTQIGTGGVTLSGGQKQRVSIARALVRNPRLLLLDEATSNLDSETERAVQAVFERTKRSRTMVVVAHRLATVQNADVIFVMGEGRVMEKGNHVTLLRQRGLYYQMCQSQALDL
ncbi:p-loop containing nucleoside triphosphate hydrolase [Pleurostoma richardsiae]|uniref:P-loop containing nucleoside triphosphate hydrolase n=1 Tax=Pleurostoma richardsiae TaxID=41990 RepID=A0AA38RAS5_9PEZI|nr:p-loop containing nucleoside triphosphate hydrolase [Pleurostoma richardsiae]